MSTVQTPSPETNLRIVTIQVEVVTRMSDEKITNHIAGFLNSTALMLNSVEIKSSVGTEDPSLVL